jgi:hypothetical protein
MRERRPGACGRTAANWARGAAALALIASMLWAAVPAAGSLAARSPLARAARSAVQVAIVQSASGGHLFVRRKATGAVSALRSGGRIYFGDVVLAGRGAVARFKVTVPPGFSVEAQLLYIKPVEGAHPKITLRGSGRTTEVTLGP